MKRILGYTVALALLLLLAWFTVLNKGEGSINPSEKEFAIKDTASIARIYMADLAENEVLLERKSDAWYVNGQYPVRKDAIEQLLHTMRQLDVNYPVAKSAHNNVVREIASKHTKVEIFNKDGQLMKSFFVGPPSPTFRGSYMKLEKAKTPFVVHIKGFDGFLGTRFFLDEELWRDRSVYNSPVDKILSFEMEYTLNPDSSFKVIRYQKDSFGLQTATGYVSGNKRINKKAVMAYLGFLKNLNCEVFMNDYPGKDSVLMSKPALQMVLTPAEGENEKVSVYLRPVTSRSKSQFDPQGNPEDFDRDKYFALINKGLDFVLIQDFVFAKLFVGPGFFYQSEPQ